MTTTRKQYSPQFKARVATEAIRGEKTLSQLGSQFKVHPMQIAKWRMHRWPQICPAHGSPSAGLQESGACRVQQSAPRDLATRAATRCGAQGEVVGDVLGT